MKLFLLPDFIYSKPWSLESKARCQKQQILVLPIISYRKTWNSNLLSWFLPITNWADTFWEGALAVLRCSKLPLNEGVLINRSELSNQQPLVSEGEGNTHYTATAKSIWQEGKVKPLLTHHFGSSMDTFRTTMKETLYRELRVQYHVLTSVEYSTKSCFTARHPQENSYVRIPLAQEWSAPFWRTAFPFIASQISATHWLRIMNFYQLQCSAKNTPKPIYL